MTLFPFGAIRSFGAKLSLLVTLTSGLAVILVCAILVFIDYRDLRNDTVAFVISQANIVAINNEAPLSFADATSSAETLAALRAQPAVAAATVYTPDGKAFARYRPGHRTIPPEFSLQQPGHQVQGKWLVVTNAIARKDETLGWLQIIYDMSAVNARLWSNVVVSLAVATLATSIAFLLATRIKQVLAKPVAELANTARKVSQSRDYSIRAAKYSEDELGQFTDVFNEMLQQIQQQDLEIQQADQQRAALLESERAARADAERASRMKDEFVATLSHELRTPLTAILGWAQMLRKQSSKPEEAQRGLEIIERNARVQTQMIEDLLDMSRIISGKIRLDVQQVNLVEVIEAALATVRPAAQAKDIKLQSVLDPGIGPVRGDSSRLQQVVWNLLSNAIKFTPRNGRVQVALERVNSHVEITVSDSGQGIRSEFLPYVFERFRQADSSTTRRHGGLGLGLAIVKQLVELHGGTVRAKSGGEGQGATFSVELPLIAVHGAADSGDRQHPRVEKPSAIAAADTPSLHGLRVMIVDDQSDARELIVRLLEQCSAVVQGAASSRDALDAMIGFLPDVLISDIGMPDEDGYEFIRKVRALNDDQLSKTPAAALTAFARSEDRTRALLAGYQLHLAKPVDPSELIATVASLAGLARQRSKPAG